MFADTRRADPVPGPAAPTPRTTSGLLLRLADDDIREGVVHLLGDAHPLRMAAGAEDLGVPCDLCVVDADALARDRDALIGRRRHDVPTARPFLPVLLVVPLDRVAEVQADLGRTVDDLITWPADPAEFQARLGRLLERRWAAAERRRLWVQALPVPVVVVDLDGVVNVWSAPVERLWGVPAPAALGRRLGEVDAALADLLVPAFAGQPVSQEEFHARTPRGEVDVAVSAIPVRTASGTVDHIVVALTDMTAERRAEEIGRLQSAALEATVDAIVITDTEGTIQWVNPAYSALTGFGRDEAVGHDVSDLVRSDLHDQAYYDEFWRVVSSGEVWRGEFVNRRKDGRLYTEEQSVTPVRDRQGRITHYVAVKQDVTDRRRAEKRVEQHLEQLRALRTIDTAIASSLDLSMTIDIVLEQTVRELRVDAAALLLLNPDLQMLEIAGGRGFRKGPARHVKLRVGEGSAGRAALERRMIHLPDLDQVEPGTAQALGLGAEGFVSYFGVPLIAKGQVRGVLEVYHRSRLHPDDEWLDFLKTVAGQAAIAIDNLEMYDTLQRTNLDLLLAYDVTLEGWMHALDRRDKEPEGHTRRVTEMTVQLARDMGLGERDLVHIRRGALLHDVGKLGVPDHVLLKPGALSAEEWQQVRQHPVYAYEWLSGIAFLRPALDIPYCHHERWDGSGYPRGLRGEEIPLAARLFAVIDVYEGMTSDRPYRKGWPQAQALAHIREQAGKGLDPAVVEAFLRMMEG